MLWKVHKKVLLHYPIEAINSHFLTCLPFFTLLKLVMQKHPACHVTEKPNMQSPVLKTLPSQKLSDPYNVLTPETPSINIT